MVWAAGSGRINKCQASTPNPSVLARKNPKPIRKAGISSSAGKPPQMPRRMMAPNNMTITAIGRRRPKFIERIDVNDIFFPY
jgi:hypothetical protein